MAGRRHELTDKDWSIIEPLLPNKPREVSAVDYLSSGSERHSSLSQGGAPRGPRQCAYRASSGRDGHDAYR